MKYCWKCGNQLRDDAVFCDKCGAKVVSGEEKKETEQVKPEPEEKKPEVKEEETKVEETKKEKERNDKDGEIFKCPFCGEILPYDAVVCPCCGKELRGRDVSQSLQSFVERLANTHDPFKKAELIRNFPIPNSREDIMEFMLLASTNYYAPVYPGEKNRSIEIAAWRTKMDQCYKKAHMLLEDPKDLEEIDNLYFNRKGKEKVQDNVDNGRKAIPFRIVGVISIPLTVIFFVMFCVCIGIFAASITTPPTNTHLLNPEILTSASTINDNEFRYQTPENEGYYSIISISSNGSSELGSYVNKDYLFHSYNASGQNEITITYNFYNSKTMKKINDYKYSMVEIYKGNKNDGPTRVESYNYTTNGNTVKYSSFSDIYLYSIKVGFSFQPQTYNDVALVFAFLNVLIAGAFLPLSIVFNIVASKMNRNARITDSNDPTSTLGREEIIRRQELEEERRERERIERKEREKEERDRKERREREERDRKERREREERDREERQEREERRREREEDDDD